MGLFGDIVGQVFRAIWAHKLRSFLTMFGIAWGVASLLLLIGMGEGFRSGQQRQLKTLGENIIMMWGGTLLSNQGNLRPYKLTQADEAEIRTQAPDVANVTGFLQRGDLKQQSQFQSAGGAVMGIEANYPTVRNLPLGKGRQLNEQDMKDRRMVAVIGKKSETLLFPNGGNGLGEFITINGYRFQVVGVAQWIGRGNRDGDNQRVYIPLPVMQNIFPMKGENIPQDALTSIQYQPVDPTRNALAKTEVRRIVAQNHNFDPTDEESIEEWDTIKSQQTVGKIFTAMDVFLGGVGIVTLALGAVGIVNIMLVTVSERTREIGLLKALGATRTSILSQIMMEGLVLTGVSGFVGISGAAIFMGVLGLLMGDSQIGFDPPKIVPWSAALALGTLTLCGVLACLYPAHKASMLEPVEALRKD